jgi:hypothetical protein
MAGKKIIGGKGTYEIIDKKNDFGLLHMQTQSNPKTTPISH